MTAPVTTPMGPKEFRQAREELLSRPGQISSGRRQALTALTDEWLAGLFAAAGGSEQDCALVALGGYGRRELAPGSDLDLLLLHTGDCVDVAEAIWYPVWDSRVPLDHSVRTVPEARRMAAEDLKVVLGLLDARTVCGDDELRRRLTESVLSDWRGLAPKRLPQLLEMVEDRRQREGELAYLLEPDLKEAYGGLRDLTVLRAVAASWVTDVEHVQLGGARRLLLGVRDALHLESGQARSKRGSDKLLMQEQSAVAARLGYADSRDLSRDVSAAGRTVGYSSDETWYRVRRLTSRVRRGPLQRMRRRGRGPDRRPLAEGVVEQDGAVVLAEGAQPDRDPVLVLRAAAAAAQVGLPISPHTLRRLADESAPMPIPWPIPARDALVAFLEGGRSAIAIWEGLDQVGMIERLIPQWAPVRSAPQRNPVHRYTVDRHLVEAAVEAARLQREVRRPDLLVVAALLHDIGKGRPDIDHSTLGAELVAEIAPQMGFDDVDTETLVRLVRHHLLLPEAATRRDLDDPATVDAVVAAVQDSETLEVLNALTRADAAATGPKAWSDWKAALVADLVARASARIEGQSAWQHVATPMPYRELLSQAGLQVRLADAPSGLQIAVAADDRRGLLATVAGVLSLHRLDVRAARTLSEDARALSLWTVVPTFGDPPVVGRLGDDLRRALDGSLDLEKGVQRREDAYPLGPMLERPPNTVDVIADASEHATVVEVRAHDRPGTLYRLSSAISDAGLDVQVAKVESRGASVVDTFYVIGEAGGPLNPVERETLREALVQALQG